MEAFPKDFKLTSETAELVEKRRMAIVRELINAKYIAYCSGTKNQHGIDITNEVFDNLWSNAALKIIEELCERVELQRSCVTTMCFGCFYSGNDGFRPVSHEEIDHWKAFPGEMERIITIKIVPSDRSFSAKC